jgi:hypothetical protein
MRYVKYVTKLNTVLLVWLACRVVNLFVFHVAEHRGLHKEALLLLNGPCKSHGDSISGHLIDCAQARTLAQSKTWVVSYAIEHVMSSLVLDAWRGATRELAQLVRLLGLITTCVFTSAFVMHSMYVKVQHMKMSRQHYNESFMESTGLFNRLPTTKSHAPPTRICNFDFDDDEFPTSRRIPASKFD